MITRLKKAIPVKGRRAAKIRRAQLFERAGSERYSRPALNALDTKLLEYLPDEPGVFLEIGANDGYSQSNTYYLERFRGWRGVLIEPLPDLFDVCSRIRPKSACFNTACVSDQSIRSVTIVDMNLVSVTLGMQDRIEESSRLYGGRRLEVPAATMSAILDEAGEHAIDFMSIDVEGVELEVLRGLDMSRHCPKFLLVETSHPEMVRSAVSPHMAQIAQLSFHDYLFERLSSAA